MQVFLQLHDGDEAGFVDWWKHHYGAGDERAVAGFLGRGFIDGDGEAGRFHFVLRQTAFDAECAAEGAGEAADVE